MDGRRVAARRRHVSCCVDMAPSWAPPKSDDAHDDATLVLMPFASSLDGWRLCGRALWAGLCPSCPVGTPARSQPSEEHSQTCSECRHTFCRSHRASPRSRTRCAACRGVLACPLCEELQHAAASPSFCPCCVLSCSSCGRYVCHDHCRRWTHNGILQSMCFDSCEVEQTDFMRERAAQGLHHHSMY